MRISTRQSRPGIVGTALFVLALSTRLPAAGALQVAGQVADPMGLPIPGSQVVVLAGDNSTLESYTDDHGRFLFDLVRPGRYAVRVRAAGFADATAVVELSEAHPRRTLSLALKLAVHRDEATVTAERAPGVLDSEAAGTQILGQRELAMLPDDPGQLMARLQMLAADTGGIPGQAIINIDGFSTASGLPPKSAIREVRINPDLYSAQYDRPPYMGGLIEIFTKPGSESVHGALFFDFNDATLNAREAFALTRPPSRTERYGLEFGTPLVKRKAGISLNLERQQIDDFSIVNAPVLDSNLQPTRYIANVAAPQQLLLGAVRADWQITTADSVALSYTTDRRDLKNEDVGASVLPEAGYGTKSDRDNLRVSDTLALGSSAMNEARLGLTWQHEIQSPNSTAPAIEVLGAFQAGGSPLQSLDERVSGIEMDDSISVAKKGWTFRTGIQVVGSHNWQFRTEDFNGVYILGGTAGPDGSLVSGLDQYRNWVSGVPGAAPSMFTIMSGNPELALSQWQIAAFAQDEWHVSRNLSVSLGLRLETQTTPAVGLNWAPRLGLAYAPDRRRRWVVRLRAGLFSGRLDQALAFQARYLDGLQRVEMSSTWLPDGVVVTVADRRILDSGLRSPLSFQPQAGVEHQLRPGLSLNASFTWARSWRAVRSRNINAPESPDGPRPLGPDLNLFRYESTGASRGTVLFTGLNESVSKAVSIFGGYLRMDFRSNADSADLFPQSSYTDSGEWARPSWQSTNRLFVAATARLPLGLSASLFLAAASGLPYNVTTGRDNNGDGIFNDRPGIVAAGIPDAVPTAFGYLTPDIVDGNLPRNSGTSPSTLTVDLNISRRFVLRKSAGLSERGRALTTNLRGTNVLNRLNPTAVNGVLGSPLFGTANASDPARRIEAGLRLEF